MVTAHEGHTGPPEQCLADEPRKIAGPVAPMVLGENEGHARFTALTEALQRLLDGVPRQLIGQHEGILQGHGSALGHAG